MAVLVGLLALGGVARPVQAQAALAASSVDPRRVPPDAQLTLRPEPGLAELAQRVARVLELRTGARVEVGESPPPGVMEAVPSGHVAMALRDGELALVMGAAGGRSINATVGAGEEGGGHDRAIALAVEALQDAALESAPIGRDEQGSQASAPASGRQTGGDRPATAPSGRSQARVLAKPRLSDDPRSTGFRSPDLLGDVDPLIFGQLYSGVAIHSGGLMLGLGGGLGLCVEGYCLVLAAQVPLNPGDTPARDVRYRYTTFTSGFHARPLRFDAFTPGLSLEFLTRVGNFEEDMQIDDLRDQNGLESDLGVRGALELSFNVTELVALMGQLGFDMTIDRWRLSDGNTVAYRGDRLTPWLQMSLRVGSY